MRLKLRLQAFIGFPIAYPIGMVTTLRAAAFLDKGGTGKTTVTAHIGVALVQEGYDVLLVDLAGKQGDLAKSFGV